MYAKPNIGWIDAINMLLTKKDTPLALRMMVMTNALQE